MKAHWYYLSWRLSFFKLHSFCHLFPFPIFKSKNNYSSNLTYLYASFTLKQQFFLTCF
jgi:hypothetical protein